MRKHGIKALGIIFAVLAIVCCAFDAMLSDSFAAFSNPIEIQGKHIVENDETLVAGRHIFVLTAKDGAPMPGDLKTNVSKVIINSNESFSFGQIEYDRPGIYSYTVSREINKSEKLIQDDSVYNCVVEVSSDGTAVVIFEKKGTEGKPNSIVYTDRLINPAHDDDRDVTPDDNPKIPGIFVRTGDGSDPELYLIVFLSVLIILGAMSADRIRLPKKDK